LSGRYKNCVCRIPGHGGTDPGAVNTALGLREADINLDTALRLERILKNRGYETKMSRTTNKFVSLTDRANMANEWGADYFISVHSNANENPEVSGTETLYYPGSRRGEALAKEVQNQMVLQLHRGNRGIIPRPNLAVLRLTKMPAILAELAFVSNLEEAELLSTPEFRQAAAQGIADGLTQFLKEQ